MNYYISDLHLCHKNVIKLDNRPFETIEEHDTELIRRWNEKVSNKDRVYILGDLCWSKENEWARIVSQLNGKKVLIRGNHDPKHLSVHTRRLFEDVKDYKEIRDDGRRVIMCHYPIPFYKADYNEDTYMLHGHVHDTRENKILNSLKEQIKISRENALSAELADSHAYNRAQIYNVGAMMPWMDYTPQTLDEIIFKYMLEEEI